MMQSQIFFYKIDGKVRGPNESLTTEIKNKGATEFLLQNIDTFLHHANNHLNAGVEESVINELTNASNEKNAQLNSWLSRKLITDRYNSFSVSKLKEKNYSATLDDLYVGLKERIIDTSHELSKLRSLDHSLISSRERETNFIKLRQLENQLDNYRELLAEVVEKMAYEHEEEEISQLRENE